jgi:hypothetical protein
VIQHSLSASLSELGDDQEEANMPESLSAYERETIITFNKAKDGAHILLMARLARNT